MCEVASSGDVLIFRGPELETVMAFLTAKNLAERVELREDGLIISPAIPEVEAALSAICNLEVSTLLLDVKESLVHMGWLVDGERDVVRVRKSRRFGVSGFITVEYDKNMRKMTVVTTGVCLADTLRNLGFAITNAKYLLEAERRVENIAQVLELEERLSLSTC